MPTTDELLAMHRRYGLRHYGGSDLGVVIIGANPGGIEVFDTVGNVYFDMAAGYSSVPAGHDNTEIRNAFNSVTVNVIPNIIPTREFILAEMAVCQALGYDKVVFMNSGAEGVETAIKIARKWAYTVKDVPPDKAQILVPEGDFHGRTTTISGMSTDKRTRKYFGPYANNAFTPIPFGNFEVTELLVGGAHVAAVLLEAFQGEGGINFPPSEYLGRLQAQCKKYNVPLIVDEIQTGLGRTGKILASHWSGVHPDMVILGKALGGGFLPVSAVVGSAEFMDVLEPGEHGGTYSGNPRAAAVAMKVFEMMERDNWCGRSRELGAYFLEKLRALESPLVTEVRGRGLFIGAEVNTRRISVGEMHKRLLAEGILTVKARSTIRFTPALTISQKQIDNAVERIARAFAARGYGGDVSSVEESHHHYG